jgi:hypothetical protein
MNHDGGHITGTGTIHTIGIITIGITAIIIGITAIIIAIGDMSVTTANELPPLLADC